MTDTMTAADLLAHLNRLTAEGVDLGGLHVDVLHSCGTYGARAYGRPTVGPSVGGLDGDGPALILEAD